MKLLFFDTETTSIEPGSICQLSYITVDTEVKPTTPIGKNYFFTVDEMSPEAERVHGFSLEKLYELSNGCYFEDVAEEFLEDFLSADILIGHNVNFDIKFITHELEGLGLDFAPKKTFCTMKYYKDVCKLDNPRNPSTYKNPRLEEAVKFLKITDEKISATASRLFEGTGDYHDARFDTSATYLVVTEGIKKGYIPPNYITNLIRR